MAELDAKSLFSVDGLVAVVTGGGTGIGLMIAQALEANGATVYILGRRQDVLEQAARTAKFGNIHTIQADVTSPASLANAASTVAAKSKYVNLLVANAGIQGPTLQSLPKNASISEFQAYLAEWDVKVLNETFAVNTTAVLSTVIAFLDLLDKGNKAGNVETKSQIVAVSSAGAYSRVPMAGFAYAASKAATAHLVKQLATMMAPYDIRGNVIAPGVYPSDMTAGLLKDNKNGTFPRDFIPAERVGDVKDMAGAILFLASRAGGYINGNVLLTDGGRVSIIPATY